MHKYILSLTSYPPWYNNPHYSLELPKKKRNTAIHDMWRIVLLRSAFFLNFVMTLNANQSGMYVSYRFIAVVCSNLFLINWVKNNSDSSLVIAWYIFPLILGMANVFIILRATCAVRYLLCHKIQSSPLCTICLKNNHPVKYLSLASYLTLFFALNVFHCINVCLALRFIFPVLWVLFRVINKIEIISFAIFGMSTM